MKSKSKMEVSGRSGNCQEEKFKVEETGQEFIFQCSQEGTQGLSLRSILNV